MTRALLVALGTLGLMGCTIVPYRTSARFFEGKYNALTRTPTGLLVSVLNYCGSAPCREPQVEVEWQDHGMLRTVTITYAAPPQEDGS